MMICCGSFLDHRLYPRSPLLNRLCLKTQNKKDPSIESRTRRTGLDEKSESAKTDRMTYATWTFKVASPKSNTRKPLKKQR